MQDDQARARFAAVAACLALCCALALAACVGAEEEGVVATQTSALRVREAPSLEAKPIAKAERGERVAVLEKSADGAWLRVRTAKGDVGWVSAKFVSLVRQEKPEHQVAGGVFAMLVFLAIVGVVLFLLWKLKPDRLSSTRETPSPAASKPPPAQEREPEPAYGSRAAWVVSVAVAAAVAAGLYYLVPPPHDPQTNGKPAPPGPTPPEPKPQLQPRIDVDVQACREALELVASQPGDTPEDRENKELEARWIQYLADIQSAGDHANWSGRPCELYVQNHRRPAADAVRRGLAIIQAQGNNLRTVTVRVTITSPAGGSIVVPVGTLFASASAGKQNMMAATSFRFVFAPVPAGDSRSSLLERVNPIGTAHAVYRPAQRPRTIERPVPAYCINRWRDVPGSDSRLAVSFPDASERLPRLVSCLERQAGSHRAKQLAVWMISDSLIDLTRAQLEDRLYAERAKSVPQTGAELAARLKEIDPSVSEELLRQARSLPREDLARVFAARLRQEAQKDLARYAATEPLLRGCGYDVSGSAFFRK